MPGADTGGSVVQPTSTWPPTSVESAAVRVLAQADTPVGETAGVCPDRSTDGPTGTRRVRSSHAGFAALPTCGGVGPNVRVDGGLGTADVCGAEFLGRRRHASRLFPAEAGNRRCLVVVISKTVASLVTDSNSKNPIRLGIEAILMVSAVPTGDGVGSDHLREPNIRCLGHCLTVHHDPARVGPQSAGASSQRTRARHGPL